MTKNIPNFEKLNSIPTPFYYYDLDLLKSTLNNLKTEANKYNYIVHYALKANVNEPILKLVHSAGLGADCVSINEIKLALKMGFAKDHIVFAGVGKRDDEISQALDANIFSFNCESIQELEVINEIAQAKEKIAPIALRINPNVNANTHKYITTGLDENKFGINLWELESVIESFKKLTHLKLVGIHFHIGSQITDLQSFKELALKVSEINDLFFSKGVDLEHVNLGGGLGINYQNPDQHLICDFASYFKLFADNLKVRAHQKVHFELGRAIVAQCGTLFSKALYIKHGQKTNFVILDAGMTELMRPALYQAYHKVENISKLNQTADFMYDVVGPICESSDSFHKAYHLPETKRGDLIAIRSAGAYGEVMASTYNSRELVKAYYSE